MVNPPKPQRSDKVPLYVDVSADVVDGDGQVISEEWTCGMFCMQGTYRAPMLIKTYGEGPIMGLN